jgi:hypothetical protein
MREIRMEQRRLHNEEVQARQLEERRTELRQLAADSRKRREAFEDEQLEKLPYK